MPKSRREWKRWIGAHHKQGESTQLMPNPFYKGPGNRLYQYAEMGHCWLFLHSLLCGVSKALVSFVVSSTAVSMSNPAMFLENGSIEPRLQK